MELHSIRLNQIDHNYFKNNFEIKATNVSSLDEADLILLGEYHTSREHRIKNCWLLNKLASDGDKICIEGFSPGTILNKKDFQKQYHYPIFQQVKIKGWDCEVTLKRYLEFCTQALFFTNWLERTISFHEKGKLEDEEKIKAISKMSAYFSREKIQKKIEKMQTLQFTFEDRTERVLTLPIILNRLAGFAKLAPKAKGEKLNALFLLASSVINRAIILVNEAKLDGTHFYRRNLSFAKEMSQPEKEQKKIYALAGASHLLFPTASDSEIGVRRSVEELTKVLQKRKYAILLPTESRENIEYVEKYFDRSRFQTLKDAVGMFFSDCLRPERLVGWLTIGGILSLAAKANYFSFVAPPLILGTFGIIAKQAYQRYLPEKQELCEILVDDYHQRIDLAERIEHLLELIPKEIHKKIKDCFLDDGTLKLRA